MLDEKSPVPLYYQLQEIIRSRIESGQWQPGQQLPPEAELCEEFQPQPRDGAPGAGGPGPRGAAQPATGQGQLRCYPQDLSGPDDVCLGLQRLRQAGDRDGVVQPQHLREHSSRQQLRLRAVERTHRQRSDRGSQGEARQWATYFLATFFLPKEMVPGLEKEDISEGSLFEFIRDKYGVQVTMAKGWFEPVLVNEYESSILNVEKG